MSVERAHVRMCEFAFITSVVTCIFFYKSSFFYHLHCRRTVPFHCFWHVFRGGPFAPLQHVAQVELRVGGAQRGAGMAAAIGVGSAFGEGNERGDIYLLVRSYVDESRGYE